MHIDPFRQLSLAYIDPAAGTLLLQTVIGGLLGVLAFFRRSIVTGVRRLLGRKDPAPKPDDPGHA